MDPTEEAGTAHEPFRSWPLGLILRAIGYPLMLAALVLWLGATLPGFRGLGLRLLESPLWNTLAFMGMGLLGAAAVRVGKGIGGRDARKVLARSGKPPILYLRSFLDEGAGQEPVEWSSAVPLVTPSDEENLTAALKPLGPMVAIGRPGDSIPGVGAARLYVSDADWRDEVDSLLARSQLVVLRVGSTDGFWWEVERAIQAVPPERLLFFFGPDGPELAQWQAFRERAAGLIPVELPKVIMAPPFLAFRSDWTPEFFAPDEEIQSRRRAMADALAPLISRISRRANRDVEPTSVPEKTVAPPGPDSLYEVPPEARTQRLGAWLFFAGALLVLLAPILPRWVAEGGRPRPLWAAMPILVGTGLWVGGLIATLKGRRFRDVSPVLRYAMVALVILVVPVTLFILAILVAVD